MPTQPSNIHPNILPNTRPLILGTLSFAVCFMAWGMISAFAPRFREMFSLSATQTALLVAARIGWHPVFQGAAVLLIVWGIAFGLLARNAPSTARPKGIGEMLGVLRRERLAWVLSLFYFLTFGGFVAFSIYLPSLLKDQ